MEIKIKIEQPTRKLPFPRGFKLCWKTAIAWATGKCVIDDGDTSRSYSFWQMISVMTYLNETEINLSPWGERELVQLLLKYNSL